MLSWLETSCPAKTFDNAGQDVQQALEANEVKQKDAQESTSPERNKQKAEYMSMQSQSKQGTDKASAQKSKNQFAIVAGIGFFIIPLAFVAVAISSGYLQVGIMQTWLANIYSSVHGLFAMSGRLEVP